MLGWAVLETQSRWARKKLRPSFQRAEASFWDEERDVLSTCSRNSFDLVCLRELVPRHFHVDAAKREVPRSVNAGDDDLVNARASLRCQLRAQLHGHLA